MAVGDAFASDPEVVVWWGTPVECMSAIARRERDGTLSAAGVAAATDRLDALERAWTVVQPAEAIRTIATRLLRVHAIRAADALQLAAAIVVAEGRPGSLPVVTLDEHLALATQREGFRTLDV
jgi:hypothetical protein